MLQVAYIDICKEIYFNKSSRNVRCFGHVFPALAILIGHLFFFFLRFATYTSLVQLLGLLGLVQLLGQGVLKIAILNQSFEFMHLLSGYLIDNEIDKHHF